MKDSRWVQETDEMRRGPWEWDTARLWFYAEVQYKEHGRWEGFIIIHEMREGKHFRNPGGKVEKAVIIEANMIYAEGGATYHPVYCSPANHLSADRS